MAYAESPIGISLKPQHYSEILHDRPQIGWLELHPENYMSEGGESHRVLSAIADRYPLSFHSVGLSLGRAEGPDLAHLERFDRLCSDYDPCRVSDHLAWTSSGGTFFNDLLPFPYTQASLKTFCNAVDIVQTRLGRRILVENPSQYAALDESEMAESDFLNALTRRSGCGLLLDLNNIYVCSQNLGFDPTTYLDAIDLSQVGEVHLAGHTCSERMGRKILIDDHGSEVCSEVWSLFADLLNRIGPVSTLIEWDTDVPSLERLLQEAEKAQSYVRVCVAGGELHALAG